MTSSAHEVPRPQANKVRVTDDTLTVELVDGRTVSAPVTWFPRLAHATADERSNWRLVGRGEGIHWPDLDEDISVDSLLKGLASGETQASLDRWLKSREGTG